MAQTVKAAFWSKTVTPLMMVLLEEEESCHQSWCTSSGQQHRR